MAEAERSLPRSPAVAVAEPEASAERSRRDWRVRIRNVLYPVGVVLGVLVIWEAGTRMHPFSCFMVG